MKTELTNEQVDEAIRKDGLPRGAAFGVNSVTGGIYRSSQARNAQEAYNQGAFRYVETCFGYSAACDSLENMCQVAELMDHNSSRDDIRLRLVIDGKNLPECALSDYLTEIHRYLFRNCSE